VDDFKRNKMIITITITCLTVILLLSLVCAFACRKYRRLQNQYYERVNLLKTNPNGVRFSDPGNRSLDRSSSGSQSDRKSSSSSANQHKLPGTGKRQIVYKLEEE
jgi:hypothetical protein